ncbi:cytochrome b5 [Pseudohyphozyma bogoriensis]|nr:cytochrome b5 [Pseudohyphozyma bogoriensis]
MSSLVESVFGMLPPPIATGFRFMNLDNPTNLVLLALVVVLIRSLVPSTPFLPLIPPTTPLSYNWRPEAHAPAMVWRTWTPEDLAGYDGTPTGKEDGRILFAIRRKVYDVSGGRSFYGPGGPYANFAGRDASRGLAKQSFDEDMLTPVTEPIDSLEDLTPADWENLKDWESHFGTKYFQCGDYVQP